MSNFIRRMIGFDIIDNVLEKGESRDIEFLKKISNSLDIKVTTQKLMDQHKVNSSIFFCTHHSGALDFLGGFPFLHKHTHNLKIIVNKRITSFKPLQNIFIGVEPVNSSKSNTLARQEIVEHLRNHGSLMVFPAGKVAQKCAGTLNDQPWRYGIIDILNAHANFAVPVYIEAENGPIFYRVRKIFPKVSMLFLLACLKYNKNKNIKIIMGEPIPVRRLQGLEPKVAIEYIRNQAYELKDLIDS